MRWKITTKKEVKDLNEKQLEKKTIVTRAQYITVGDIVGAGKSAAGAVQKLAKSLPAFINKLKDDPKGMAMALGVNSIINPLATMITGMDQYKKVMGVIDSLTPVMKLVARASGLWCSPGNAADIAQIVLGTAQQLLIQVATSSILKLKEMVWNYEFKIREISNETSMLLTKKLKNFDKNNTVILKKDIFNNLGGQNNIHYNFAEAKKKMDEVIDQTFPEEEIQLDTENILNILKGEEVPEKKKLERRINYVSKTIVGTGTSRLFAGSLNDKGIYYSDDNGKTWNETNITNGSFNAFESIVINGKYLYVAGSTEEVISVKPTLDTKYVDENNQYYKDYYNKDLKRYSKIEKDEMIKNKETSLFNDIEDSHKGIGIYYSEDNGKTWKVSDLSTGKFENIKQFNNGLVASSYDYEGIYYSDNGKTWNRSLYNNKEIKKGRWTIFRSLDDTSTRIHFSYIANINKFNVGEIDTFETINSMNIPMDIKMNINCYQGEGLDNFGTYNTLITNIIDYLHVHYKDSVLLKDNTFWEGLIQDIKDGNYTMEDAINGKDMQGE